MIGGGGRIGSRAGASTEGPWGLHVARMGSHSRLRGLGAGDHLVIEVGRVGTIFGRYRRECKGPGTPTGVERRIVSCWMDIPHR